MNRSSAIEAISVRPPNPISAPAAVRGGDPRRRQRLRHDPDAEARPRSPRRARAPRTRSSGRPLGEERDQQRHEQSERTRVREDDEARRDGGVAGGGAPLLALVAAAEGSPAPGPAWVLARRRRRRGWVRLRRVRRGRRGRRAGGRSRTPGPPLRAAGSPCPARSPRGRSPPSAGPARWAGAVSRARARASRCATRRSPRVLCAAGPSAGGPAGAVSLASRRQRGPSLPMQDLLELLPRDRRGLRAILAGPSRSGARSTPRSSGIDVGRPRPPAGAAR